MYLPQSPSSPWDASLPTSPALCAVPGQVSCSGCPHSGLVTLPGMCAHIPTVPAGRKGPSATLSAPSRDAAWGQEPMGTVASMVSATARAQWPGPGNGQCHRGHGSSIIPGTLPAKAIPSHPTTGAGASPLWHHEVPGCSPAFPSWHLWFPLTLCHTPQGLC